MKILCLTPIKHLNGMYNYLSSFGSVDYKPDLQKFDFNYFNISNYDVIFCNPNKQNYLLDETILKNFKGIILTASTGLNHIDVDYCKNVGIEVLSHTKDYDLLNLLPSTAELAFGLIISIMRNIPKAVDDVKLRGWDYEQFMGNQLYEKTIGIIGYGRLGKMMHNYCSAFGMNVKIYDPYKGHYDIDALLNFSDIISLHVHVTDETRNMINQSFLQKMKQGSFLINTSRGEIVDEGAILTSLRDGHLKGYAADVISDEYGNRDKSPILSGLRNGLNIIVTPHVGGMTWEGQEKAYRWAIDKLCAY